MATRAPRRTPYPPTFRARAVELAQTSGLSQRELARDLGVDHDTLARWLRQADAGARRSPRGRSPRLMFGRWLAPWRPPTLLGPGCTAAVIVGQVVRGRSVRWPVTEALRALPAPAAKRSANGSDSSRNNFPVS